MILKNAVGMAHQLLLPKVRTATCLVDATAGNGKDTLFLALNSLPQAKIWAFDIQQVAVDKTRQLLVCHGVADKVQLILADHCRIPFYVNQPIDVAMFNLGYLPGHDHSLTTMPETTEAALLAVLKLLAPGGVVTVVGYPGHPTGTQEVQMLEKILPSLPQSSFTVGCWKMLNQINNPPLLYIIERKERNH